MWIEFMDIILFSQDDFLHYLTQKIAEINLLFYYILKVSLLSNQTNLWELRLILPM